MKFIRLLCIAIASLPLLIAAPQAAKSTDTGKAAASDKKSASSAAPKADLLDINSATEEQLNALPEVGQAYAKKIIAGRPYKSKSESWCKKRSFRPPPTIKFAIRLLPSSNPESRA